MAMRDEILQGFAEQRALVDALTNVSDLFIIWDVLNL